MPTRYWTVRWPNHPIAAEVAAMGSFQAALWPVCAGGSGIAARQRRVNAPPATRITAFFTVAIFNTGVMFAVIVAGNKFALTDKKGFLSCSDRLSNSLI